MFGTWPVAVSPGEVKKNFSGSMYAKRSSVKWVTSWGLGDLQALRILIYFPRELMIWVEMRHVPLLPGWQSGCILVGFAAVGDGAIIGISLDVTSLVIFTDPALSKNCFAHLLEIFRRSQK